MAQTHPVEDLLRNVETYLREQQMMFGEELFREPSRPAAAAPPAPAAAGTQETDLFGVPDAPDRAHRAHEPVLTMMNETWIGASTLQELNGMICDCMKCSLGTTRTKFVFGVGNPQAKAMLIGEAPGADEDAQGEPFVGRAGQLLNKILEAIKFKREEVYICNILKCRPPNNRDPLPGEMELCSPYLWKQIDLIKPAAILCLGRISAQTLLATTDTLTKLRGRVHQLRGIPLMVTYHPAALLRNPNWKVQAWEDVKAFRALYDERTAG